MNVTKQLLGMFLILVGGLALIDWVLSFGLSGGSNQPILDFILYGELHISGSDPILFTLWLWVCPGNGFAAFCEPLGFFFFVVGVLAVVICLVVNRSRGAAPIGDDFVSGRNRSWRFHNLALYAAAICAVSFSWTLIHAILGPDYPTAVSAIYLLVSTITPPLFVVATIATGLRLRRTRE